MRVFPSQDQELEEKWPADTDIRGGMDWTSLSERLKMLNRKPRKADRADVISRCRAINSNEQANQPLWKILEQIKCAHQKMENLEQALQDFDELGKKEKEKNKKKEKWKHHALSFAQLPEYNSLCKFRGGKPLFDDADVEYLRTSIEAKISLHESELDAQKLNLTSLLNTETSVTPKVPPLHVFELAFLFYLS